MAVTYKFELSDVAYQRMYDKLGVDPIDWLQQNVIGRAQAAVSEIQDSAMLKYIEQGLEFPAKAEDFVLDALDKSVLGTGADTIASSMNSAKEQALSYATAAAGKVTDSISGAI